MTSDSGNTVWIRDLRDPSFRQFPGFAVLHLLRVVCVALTAMPEVRCPRDRLQNTARGRIFACHAKACEPPPPGDICFFSTSWIERLPMQDLSFRELQEFPRGIQRTLCRIKPRLKRRRNLKTRRQNLEATTALHRPEKRHR